jgi:hypothetical protein
MTFSEVARSAKIIMWAPDVLPENCSGANESHEVTLLSRGGGAKRNGDWLAPQPSSSPDSGRS